METGYLEVITACDGVPVQAAITILSGDAALYKLQTDENGKAEAVELAAPPRGLSQDPKYMDAPYSTCNIQAEAPGFAKVCVYGVMIFDGETSIIPIDMHPENDNPREYHVPTHQLINPAGRRMETPDTIHKLLPEIKIPEFITVHMGHPDSPAPNIQVPFIDYIKNAVSHEIFPVWPSAALEANIYCIISLALNRVFTKSYQAHGHDCDNANGYGACGQDFDITNNPMFDPIYVEGGQIFRSIDIMVDSIFNRFIKREGHQEPFFAEYSDGRYNTCPGLWQWGTVDLANRGFDALHILQHYYPRDIHIVEINEIGGIEKPFPGYLLREGMSGSHVRDLQVMLNRIGVNFPGIPMIDPVTGIYGPETAAAVRAFMCIHRNETEPAGNIVNKDAWNRISLAFSAVKRKNEAELAVKDTCPIISSSDADTLPIPSGPHQIPTPPMDNISANQLLTMFLVSQALLRQGAG